jgi:hypothetical protein
MSLNSLDPNLYVPPTRSWGSRATLDKHTRNIWPYRGLELWVMAAGSMQSHRHWQIGKVQTNSKLLLSCPRWLTTVYLSFSHCRFTRWCLRIAWWWSSKAPKRHKEATHRTVSTTSQPLLRCLVGGLSCGGAVAVGHRRLCGRFARLWRGWRHHRQSRQPESGANLAHHLRHSHLTST